MYLHQLVLTQKFHRSQVAVLSHQMHCPNNRTVLMSNVIVSDITLYQFNSNQSDSCAVQTCEPRSTVLQRLQSFSALLSLAQNVTRCGCIATHGRGHQRMALPYMLIRFQEAKLTKMQPLCCMRHHYVWPELSFSCLTVAAEQQTAVLKPSAKPVHDCFTVCEQ